MNSTSNKYRFKLYLSGNTCQSDKALKLIRKILNFELREHYLLEVIDVFNKPQLAEEENIIVTPTLIKTFPLPRQEFIGDFSFYEDALNSLNLVEHFQFN